MYVEPHVVAHRIALADVLNALKRIDEARELLVQMMTHLPADVEQLHLFAEIASKLNLREEAVEAAEQAVRLDGTNAESFMVLGRIQNKFKNYSNALWAFQQAIKYDPSRKEAQQMIAHLGPLSFWRKHMGNKLRAKGK
jgi:cytochrome c-type biogenesis protein CcmH/NrfG